MREHGHIAPLQPMAGIRIIDMPSAHQLSHVGTTTNIAIHPWRWDIYMTSAAERDAARSEVNIAGFHFTTAIYAVSNVNNIRLRVGGTLAGLSRPKLRPGQLR